MAVTPTVLAGATRSLAEAIDIVRRSSVLRLSAWAVFLGCLAGTTRADIRTTPHKLVRDSVKADASDICVFCHTPNLSGKPPDRAPLWQRSIGTDLIFTIYDDIGRLGLGKASVGSQSMACLSCHDANQARAISKTSSDHPFGVPYRGATKNQPWSADASRRPAFDATNPAVWAKHLVALEDFRDVSQGIIENRTVWWVSATGTTGHRTRNDLPLYARSYGDSGDDVPFIECSSCHDPHTSNQKFLRLPNTGSQLCMTCHMK
jgi:predicted CXXCH cytochrome family protein